MAQPSDFDRYKLLLEHHRWEHSSLWTRFGFLLVSQITLFVFGVSSFIRSNGHYIVILFPIVAICLAYWFKRVFRVTYWWVDEWKKELKKIESAAIGELEISRRNTQKPVTRNYAVLVINFFMFVLWPLFLLALVFLWMND